MISRLPLKLLRSLLNVPRSSLVPLLARRSGRQLYILSPAQQCRLPCLLHFPSPFLSCRLTVYFFFFSTRLLDD